MNDTIVVNGNILEDATVTFRAGTGGVCVLVRLEWEDGDGKKHVEQARGDLATYSAVETALTSLFTDQL